MFFTVFVSESLFYFCYNVLSHFAFGVRLRLSLSLRSPVPFICLYCVTNTLFSKKWHRQQKQQETGNDLLAKLRSAVSSSLLLLFCWQSFFCDKTWLSQKRHLLDEISFRCMTRCFLIEIVERLPVITLWSLFLAAMKESLSTQQLFREDIIILLECLLLLIIILHSFDSHYFDFLIPFTFVNFEFSRPKEDIPLPFIIWRLEDLTLTWRSVLFLFVDLVHVPSTFVSILVVESSVKPRMTYLPEKKIEVAKGSPITLTCKASGHPRPNIEWRYNMERIPSTFPRIRVCTSCSNCTENEALSSLTLIEFDEGLEGKWTCEAVNAIETIMSPHDTELTLRPSSSYAARVY